MIEVKVPGIPMTGYNGDNGGAGTPVAIAKGRFMFNAGAFAAAHVAPGTPGYAATGDSPRMVMNDANIAINHAHSGWGVYPVNKIILATEGADQDNDTIASGLRLIYYIGGEYETDEYDITVSGVGTAPGDKLWLNSSGQIALTGASTANPAGWQLPPIGEVVKVSAFPATTKWYNGGVAGTYKKTVWYRLYPWHAAPAGNVMY